MRRLAPRAHAIAAIVATIVLVGGGLASNVRAQAPDESDVVLVLDFSASILLDAANRNRFGAALERIADRVDATSADLVAGDTTVSIIQFAARAADYRGCVDLKLLGSPQTVAHFADCLRAVAGAYRKGLSSALTKQIGIDTNYVAAMEQAARHLPLDSARPVMILLTDGKHDVKGVPVSQVQPARDRLFGSRSPFALLPVGMGLDPKERVALATGLERLKIIRDMPACISGTAFEWPQVVFESADQAGNAVAVALQDATCTFTAGPQPSSTPAPLPAPVTGITLTPGDGRIDLAWVPPASTPAPIIDYLARCGTGDGTWIDSTEGVSLEPSATVDGLTNGTPYQCQVAAVGPTGPGAWTAAGTAVVPLGRPGAPGKPSVQALNRAVQISIAPIDSAGVTGYHFECSGDQGATWPAAIDATADKTTMQIGDLTNGVDYLCRAFASNAIGMSDASPLSDAVKPCGSTLECNSVLVPVLGGLGIVLLGGLLLTLVALLRGRTQGYVVAVVDVVHTANIGHGSNLGIAFVRAPDRRVTGIVAERGKQADIRIRHLRSGGFVVRDRLGRHVVADGEPVVVADSVGVRHRLVLQAFATNAASQVASRQ